jgi:type VI secretion system protein ImpK
LKRLLIIASLSLTGKYHTAMKPDTIDIDLSNKSALASSKMAILPLSTAREPIARLHSYYRTKTFTVSCGINPLVTAASPLLSIAGKLRNADHYADIDSLYHGLIHEIKAFEHQALSQGYRSEVILVARYILCATLDDLILHTTWGNSSDWGHQTLLMAFQKETNGEERFFVILERLNEDPALHIDMLELIYLCLSLGFQGKYRQGNDHKNILDEIIDDLYQAIRWQRGTLSKQLLVRSSTPPATVATQHAPAIKDPVPWGLISLLLLTLLFTVIISIRYGLHHHAITHW